MKLGKNNRQVPSVKDVTSNKNYYDLMYGYLQNISEPALDGNRYISKKELSYTKLAEALKITRVTATKRFNGLIDIGLIAYDEEAKRYVLTYLNKDLATLVPEKTLGMLVDGLSQYSISIFVYLLNRYLANGEKPFDVLMLSLKDWIGISVHTTSNNSVITNVLDVLQALGLIKYALEMRDDKWHINVKLVRNTIRTN